MDLQTPGAAQMAPGRAMLDAPSSGETGDNWLLNEVQGDFKLVGFGDVVLPTLPSVRRLGINQRADYPVSLPPAATRSAAMARARPIRSAPMAMSARCLTTRPNRRC